MASETTKEKSVSLSLSDGDNQDDTADITISLQPLKQTDAKDNQNSLKVSNNRAKFMKTAPSLMRLLSIGKSSDTAPDTIANDETYNGNNSDMQTLALEAHKEFEILALQNDELFKENEQYKQRYDDLNNEIQELYVQIKEIELYKDENQRLLTENAKYQSQSVIFEQEKDIMQFEVQSLKEEIHSFSQSQDIQTHNDSIDMNKQKQININHSELQQTQTLLSLLTKEKTELEQMLENYQKNAQSNKAVMNKLKTELKESQTEVQRLSNDLTEQQNKYIKLQQTKQQNSDKYERQLSIDSNKIQTLQTDKTKQTQLLQTVQNQKKVISDLQRENDAFLKKDLTKQKLAIGAIHQRLRTQNNLFGNNSMDYSMGNDIAIGGNDEIHDSFMNYNNSFEAMDETVDENEEKLENDKVMAAYEEKQSELLETIQTQKDIINELQREKKERENIEFEQSQSGNASKCGCMLSFFERFKNGNSNKAAESHLIVKNDYILMKGDENL